MKKEKGFDLVIKAVGQTYKADFLKKSYASSVATNGQIYVNDFFQLAGQDTSSNGSVSAVNPNIFVFGDACRTSINELKNIPSLKFLAQFIVKNITAVA
jgi:hypothetical protein